MQFLLPDLVESFHAESHEHTANQKKLTHWKTNLKNISHREKQQSSNIHQKNLNHRESDHPNSTTEHVASSDWQANYMQAEPGNKMEEQMLG